jgi:hypothetical protein
MKKALPKILALAVLAFASALPAQAHKQNPITEWRRTLFTNYGQHLLVFEAPVGMCFLDESDYVEGSILAQFRNFGNNQSKLIGTFADCMEIAKIQKDYQDEITAHPENTSPPLMTLKKHGSIYWLNPDNGEDVIALKRDGYLDVREKGFRDDVMKEIHEGGHGLLSASLVDSSGKYKFDDQTRRTPDGLALAYSLATEVEYTKVFNAGIISTTLINHMPLEFSFDFSSAEPDKDSKTLYAMMDKFMAQQIKLNAQIANQ